jgi:hypothetical protein
MTNQRKSKFKNESVGNQDEFCVGFSHYTSGFGESGQRRLRIGIREGSNSGNISAAAFLLKSCENRKVYPSHNYGKIAVSGGFGLIISRQ